jgi:hypothetical protein
MLKLISKLAMTVAAASMLCIVTLPKPAAAEAIKLPHIKLPHVKTPHVKTPHVKTPHVKLPHITLPHISL